jgi:hypothetical protein
VERTRADQAMMDLNTGLPFETVIKTKTKKKRCRVPLSLFLDGTTLTRVLP